MSVGKLKRYGLPFANVAANNTATATITPGRTLETIRLKLGGTFTKVMMPLIRVKVNAKTVIEASGDQLDKINTYKGKTASASFLDIDLADFALNNEFDRHVGSWDTSQGVANITIEVAIGAATAPTLSLILVESGQQKTVQGEYAPYAGLMTKMLRYPYNISAGGKLAMPFPMGPQSGAIIKRAHFFSNAGLQIGMTIKQDGVPVHESLAAENNFDMTTVGRVPQANVYTVDFVLDGAVNKALDTRDARSLEWVPEFSGTESGTAVVEYIDVLGNL